MIETAQKFKKCHFVLTQITSIKQTQ